MLGYLLSDDLIFTSRICGTARAAGLDVKAARLAGPTAQFAGHGDGAVSPPRLAKSGSGHRRLDGFPAVAKAACRGLRLTCRCRHARRGTHRWLRSGAAAQQVCGGISHVAARLVCPG